MEETCFRKKLPFSTHRNRGIGILYLTYIYVKIEPNVGKYTSHMDPWWGMINSKFTDHPELRISGEICQIQGKHHLELW